MIKKKELQKLSESKMESLKEFHKNGHYDLVIAQSWIVVDAALKALVCKNMKKDEYPDYTKYKTNDAEKLIDIANFRNNLEKEKNNSLEFFISWSLLGRWSSEFMYKMIGISEKQSEDYIKALDDKNGGVYTWIKKHW